MDDVTLINEMVSLDSREKILGGENGSNDEPDYPDGGLRAWLVVLGVCPPSCLMISDLRILPLGFLHMLR